MKQCVLLLSFCLLATVHSIAQDEEAKPTSGDFSIGFNISGLADIQLQPWSEDAFGAPQALARYYITDQLVPRLRLGINTNSQTVDFSRNYIDSIRFAEPRTIDSVVVTSENLAVFSFSPGIEYHFTTTSKVDPYVGAEIPITVKGTQDTEVDFMYQQREEDGALVLDQDFNTKTTRDGGFSIGFNLLAGFNYFFSPKIAIGAEYGIGFLNTQDGGTVRVARTGTIAVSGSQNNIIAIDETDIFEQRTTNTGINTRATGGINLSIFF